MFNEILTSTHLAVVILVINEVIQKLPGLTRVKEILVEVPLSFLKNKNFNEK